jgi:ribosomal protein L11 methyltransferase
MPDRWFVIQALSPSAEMNDMLAEGLIASGGLAVEEDGPWLRTWLRPPADAEAEAAAVRTRLQAMTGTPVTVEWSWRAEEDWNAKWRAGLGPRRVGRHLIITPSWTAAAAGPGDLAIVIDPQMAFGTGEHASTRGVLRLLEDAVQPNATVLDAGTGSGVLAIAAARLGASHVLGVDLDADAISNAAENIVRNGCADSVRLEVAEVDAAWLQQSAAAYDVIAANILSSVLVPLLPAFRRALAPAGALLLGGVLESESDVVSAAARAAGLTRVCEDREEGWWSARFANP